MDGIITSLNKYFNALRTFAHADLQNMPLNCVNGVNHELIGVENVYAILHFFRDILYIVQQYITDEMLSNVTHTISYEKKS